MAHPYPEDRTLPSDTQSRPGADKAASDEILALILKTLEEEKAEDIVTIDLAGKSSIADHMVVCSGRSTRQVGALAEKLSERLKASLGRNARTEGKGQGDWVLLDAGDAIVHIFRPEVREFYQLEKMWLDPAAEPARST
ncbi:ribosome-associated protein [Jannaschia faecimaris]|uniref:Ribosomal silencing factor RsfS n=1 Tax=Jannaschia faecimaris TaxID=1244108 RepID=A0A1H3J506_9RHOB|nr:ribosome silencing factor [Jannaschia faecimaris]SDY35016.1 ribosome-associated protein [Jannaschia faecimaris]